MLDSKLAFKLRRQINKFSGYVSTGLDKTARRFIREAVYGILYSQTVLLTEIGRSLQSLVKLKKIEERFCRQLKKADLWDTVHRQIATDAAPRIGEETLLILDLGDITKKYAQKMQYLATVRDGSEKELDDGYWTTQVIGSELDSKQVLPLYHELYSQKAPEFISENAQILKAIDRVSEAAENRGLWVIDRGGDRRVLYEQLLEEERQFIIRLVGTRNLIYNGSEQAALALANSCPIPYAQTIVRKKDNKEKTYHLQFGYRPVRLPGHARKLWMLVVKGYGKKPMMLLTTQPLRRNRKVLWKILRSYIKRWSIEETIRFVKQCYDLENIRLLTYQRLRNMMGLLLAVFYFMAVKLDMNAKLTIMSGYILKAAKRVFGVPDFKFYAMSDGIRSIFNCSPGKFGALPLEKLNPNQLGFGFT
jgi:hypothetical protein